MPEISTRSILSWHYSRLLPFELAELKKHGVSVTGVDHMKQRIFELVKRGYLTRLEESKILNSSPLNNNEQLHARSGKFWMTASRLPPTDSGVELLLGNWGGEVVYFWQSDPAIIAKLRQIGSPTVIELCVPLAKTRHVYNAARAMVHVFLSRPASESSFDLYVETALLARAVRNVWTSNDAGFSGFGVDSP